MTVPRNSDRADAPGQQPDPDHPLPLDEDDAGLSFPHAPPQLGGTCALAPDLLWLRMPLPWSLDHINLYLLDEGEGWLAIDSGIDSRDLKARWEAAFAGPLGGRPLSRVLATHHHPDHIGLAGWLAARFGAPILASREAWLMARTLQLDVRPEPPGEVIAFARRAGLDEAMLAAQRRGGWGNYAKIVAPLPVGYRRLAGGDILETGDDRWHVIETGGHAPGHLSLFSPARRLLISGDQVLPLISSNVSVFATEPRGNPLAEWLEGLARMRALPDDILVLPSHNAPFLGLHRRLDALIGKHLERLEAVAEMCRTAATAVDVFPALFRRRVAGLEFALATGEALAHLHYLESLGIVERQEKDGVARFRTVASFDREPVVARLAHITDQSRETAPWRT
ncbi:MAG: MBL fold metallo-hydrolase [Rhodothalassiaceae bacterium]